MTVTIDRDGCTSCALCWDACPAVFAENDDDGLSEIVSAYRVDGDNAKGGVPEEHADCVQEAADGCPVEVISVG